MQNKISYKLITLIFLISFVVTITSVYIQIKTQYENKISRFEQNINNIEKNQIPLLAQSLWNVDHAVIDIFLKNLVNNEKIIYAEVLENDKVLNSVGKTKEANIIKKEFEINKQVDTQSYNIGKLIVIADLSPIYEDIKNNAIGIIFTEIIKMLLISLSIIYIMKKILTNPLERMAKYAKQLNLDNLNKPLKVSTKKEIRHNELDVVTQAINTMRVNLIKQIMESEEKNNILAQQSKLAAMGEMIGNIAHQWRQPLSLITTTTSGIKLNYELGQLNEKKLDEYTSQVINSAKYLSDTIDDFRDFFKPNKEKVHFSLLKSFNKTFTLLSSQFKSDDIHIIKNIEDIKMYGFENELIQVLINILNNAKDELLKKEDQTLLIFIDAFEKNNKVHIKIKDNAGGIEDTIIDRIFEPYFTTKHQTQGTGIGLYMSEEIIVKHMHGKLSVHNVNFTYENMEYTGAEFKIVIDGVDNENI